MSADKAMWASIALVDYLRNGVPLEETPRNHVGRALASLMNTFRLPLDEYWERRMEMGDGGSYMISLAQAGLTGGVSGKPEALDREYTAISSALADRSWPALRSLPDSVWKLLRAVTGMGRDDWDALPDFCRTLLNETVICPDCEHSSTIQQFGEPNTIDDPSYLYQQRISLVFRCPKCGTEVNYSITTGKSREFHTHIFGTNRWVKWVIVGVFAGFAVLALLYVMFEKPPF